MRSLVEAQARERWAWLDARGATPFYLLPALSGIDLGGAVELDTIYAPYESATLRAGFRVPTLYLRMTKGAAADYVFDPDWDSTRKCGARRIGDDALNHVLAHAQAKRLPVLVTLNGGIWADAYCDVPEWDINDKLEQDPANVQWNEKNEAMPDGHLKDLPGSQEAPELARSLTFNVHAAAVRHYKKRNLQQAGALLARFMAAHPDLFVGVNLDPDVYLNPFFAEQQWYDYNPGTLRQFREWLAGSGPYAGRTTPGVPDLRAYRRARPLTLADVNRIAGQQWRSWNEVDPPRAFPRTGARPFWQDPWTHEWEVFRRHLVHLHYDELAQWLVEAGIPSSRIWSSQGLMAPAGDAMPFAIDLDSPTRNYDSGRHDDRRLQAGARAPGRDPLRRGRRQRRAHGQRQVALRHARRDRSALGGGRVQHRRPAQSAEPAELRGGVPQPARPVEFRRALRLADGVERQQRHQRRQAGLLELHRVAQHRAGGGGARLHAGARRACRRACRCGPSARRRTRTAMAGHPMSARFASGRGYLTLEPDRNRRVAIVSPTGLPDAAGTAGTFVLGLEPDAGLRRVRIQGRRNAESGWETLADATSPDNAGWRHTPAGVVLKRTGDRAAGALRAAALRTHVRRDHHRARSRASRCCPSGRRTARHAHGARSRASARRSCTRRRRGRAAGAGIPGTVPPTCAGGSRCARRRGGAPA